MFTLSKKQGKDFTVLNFADIQLGTEEWENGHQNGRIVTYTVNELINRTKPDLITLSGDQSWAGHFDAYMKLGELIDSYNIPWTFVWGNHDQQDGYDFTDGVVSKYSRFGNLIFENGPCELGRGNFVIRICEAERTVSALILMDTHNMRPYTDENGKTRDEWASLYPEQFGWYENAVCELKALGCNDSAIITHIPIFEYKRASKSAYKSGANKNAESADNWNEGYKDSFGVQREEICTYPVDDGFFELICKLGSTKNYICGHDHVNCTSIKHRGVRLTYALKTGPGCYWNSDLNGGTVLTINENGISGVKHEYVDCTPALSE